MAKKSRRKPSGKSTKGGSGTKLALAGGLIVVAILVFAFQGGGGEVMDPQKAIEGAVGTRLASMVAEKASGKSFGILVFGSHEGIVEGFKEAAKDKIKITGVSQFVIEGDEESMSPKERFTTILGILKDKSSDADGLVLIGGCPEALSSLKGKTCFSYGPLSVGSIRALQKGSLSAILMESRGSIMKEGALTDPNEYVQKNFIVVGKSNAREVAENMGIELDTYAPPPR